MNHRFEFKENFCYIELEGEPDVKGLNSYINELVNHPKWVKHMSTITDFRKLNLQFLMDINKTKVYGNIVKSYEEQIGEWKNATIINQSDDNPYSNILENLLVLIRVPMTNRTFYNREDAEAWLMENS